MSRIPSSATSVSLTEKLDNLEQSITLTLQEIDQNFSRAHAIVTSRILPIVEEYSKQSNAVWDGSKVLRPQHYLCKLDFQFWKQFFESSANVSLSGVEENETANENTLLRQSPESTEKNIEGSSSQSDEDTLYTRKEEESEIHDENYDSLLENEDIIESTPRAPQLNQTREKFDLTERSISYEKSEIEIEKETEFQHQNKKSEDISATQSYSLNVPDLMAAPTLSPSKPTKYSLSATPKKQGLDPFFHRVLDKNYRLQATPLPTPKIKKTPSNKASWRDLTSPISSPPAAAPQLHADLFSSPTRPRHAKVAATRTPGISVQTPFKGKLDKNSSKPLVKEEISWESDSEEDAEDVYRELGMSPPKTIQFNLSQSKLLQTPAREASQRIVQDLLATAGARFNESDTDNSPSMIMRSEMSDDF
ncbi:DASH complex subunit ask1 [Golovinomyces cichoracearum]|uniref:DASH complex subunit ASK1 n=1 Tax=Golovinomyces cichoracearum TaxID=62708 RepID=A0A420HQS1_9PEZI|nr:DASH complex subunit ask1 [Golovinomyces cichoracearum]